MAPVEECTLYHVSLIVVVNIFVVVGPGFELPPTTGNFLSSGTVLRCLSLYVSHPLSKNDFFKSLTGEVKLCK